MTWYQVEMNTVAQRLVRKFLIPQQAAEWRQALIQTGVPASCVRIQILQLTDAEMRS